MGTSLQGHRLIATHMSQQRGDICSHFDSSIILNTTKKLSHDINSVVQSSEPDSKKLLQITQLLETGFQVTNSFIRCQAFIAMAQILNDHPALLPDHQKLLRRLLTSVDRAFEYGNANLGPPELSNLYFRAKQLGLNHHGFEQHFLSYMEKNISEFNSLDISLSMQALSFSDRGVASIHLLIDQIDRDRLNALNIKSCACFAEALATKQSSKIDTFITAVTERFFDSKPDCKELINYLHTVISKPVDFDCFYKRIIEEAKSLTFFDSQEQLLFRHHLFLIASNNSHKEKFTKFLQIIDIQNSNLIFLICLANACVDTSHEHFSKSVSDHLTKALSDSPNLEFYDPISRLTAVDIALSSRLLTTYGDRDRLGKIMPRLISYFCQNVATNNPNNGDLHLCSSIIFDCANSRYYDQSLLDIGTSLMQKNMRNLELDDIVKYLRATANLNYDIGQELAEKLTYKILATNSSSHASHEKVILASLGLLLFHKDSVEKILAKYTKKIDIHLLQPAIKAQYLRMLFLCDLIEASEVDPLIRGDFNDSPNGAPQEFEDRVDRQLQVIKTDDEQIHKIERSKLLIGIEVDFIITIGARKIILECDGDSTHLLSDGRPQGKDIIQDMIFKKLGYEVAHLSSSEWSSSNDRKDTLKQKLGINLRRKPSK